MEYNITITFQEKTAVADGKGGQVETWTNMAGLVDYQARKRLLSGNEMEENERRGYRSNERFYCDYNVSITEGLRIVYSDEYYRINFVENPHGMNAFLQIDTEKVK